jgi:hypothetical protein
LAKLYRGLKKTLVLEQAAGERDMKVGKDAFNFAMYQKIANAYWRRLTFAACLAGAAAGVLGF